MNNSQKRHKHTLRTLKDVDSHLQGNPKNALDFLLKELRDFISCETICLLVWDENKQKLITTNSNNLPENMGPEEYDFDKGLTGNYIFANENWFRGTIDCENERIYDEITETFIEDKTINWTNIQKFKSSSEFGDFKSLMGFPFVATKQWRGVLKFINKIDADGKLGDGFTYDDQIILLINFLQKLEHIFALEKNNFHTNSILRLQELTTEKILVSSLLKEVVNLCAKTLNYRICSVRLFKDGCFQSPVFNDSVEFLSNTESKEYLFSENVDEPNFRRTIFWSKQDYCEYPQQIIEAEEEEIYELTYFPECISKLIEINRLQSYISIPIKHQGNFLGIFECGAILPQRIGKQDIDLIRSFANSLALGLVNLNRSESLEKMANLSSRLTSKDDIQEIYETILNHVTRDLGFDYGVISRVNHENKTVRIKLAKTRDKDLVDPNQWKAEADYTFDDKDILVDLVKKPEIKIIIGPEVVKNWRDELNLNKEIFSKYGHKNLVRVFVPIIFHDFARKESDLVVSIIEAGYHINHQTTIPQHQIELVKLFGNFAESIYKALSLSDIKSVDKMFKIINSQSFPIDPISDSAKTYENLLKILCKYLNTNAVSVWEKVLIKESFELRLVSASEPLKALYNKHGIRTLPADCYTFDAVKSFVDTCKIPDRNVVKYPESGIIFIKEEGIRSEKFAYSNVPLDAGFKSMICIPMKVGKEIYSAIIIFTKNKVLTKGEAEALSILANRVAIVVQSAKIIENFRIFSEISPNEDIENTLSKIADSSLSVLHANSVVLFRFHNGEFISSVSKGDFYHKQNKISSMIVKEDDLLAKIINNGTHYFEDERNYLQYVRENNVQRTTQRFSEDFWQREKLKSSAAIRLELERKSSDNSVGTELVGIMFVNYRTEQAFKPLRDLIESFGSLAATAIYNTYLLEENIKFWETRRRDSFALSINEIASSLAHNSGNLLTSILLPFSRFEHQLTEKYKNETFIEKDVVENKLISKIKGPLNDLNEDFQRLKEYRKFDEFKAEPQKILPLIHSSIKLLNNRFEKQNIKINTKSLRDDAVVMCDSNQIIHLFLNLFINAADAMGNRGELSLGTEFTHQRDFIRIRVSDNGRGISNEIRSRIFEPFFTTKEKRGGTGLGLPISKYIVERHGGHIEFQKNTSAKGSSFFIHLPINKERKK